MPSNGILAGEDPLDRIAGSIHARHLTALMWVLGMASLLVALSAAFLISEENAFSVAPTGAAPLHRATLALLCCAFTFVLGATISIRGRRRAGDRPQANSWLENSGLAWLNRLRIHRRSSETHPADGDAPAGRHTAPRALSSGELRALDNACTREFAVFLKCMLLSGCRPHELSILRSAEITANGLEIGDTRTRQRRCAPLSEIALSFLEQQRADKASNDFVLRQADGRPWTRRALSSALRNACRRGRLVPRIRFRDLRQTYVVHLLQAGMPLVQVAAALGHRSTRLVESTLVAQPPAAPDRIEGLRKSVRARLISGEIPEGASELLWMFDGEERCLICGGEISSSGAAYEIGHEDGRCLIVHGECDTIRRAEYNRITAAAAALRRSALARVSLRDPYGECREEARAPGEKLPH